MGADWSYGTAKPPTNLLSRGDFMVSAGPIPLSGSIKADILNVGLSATTTVGQDPTSAPSASPSIDPDVIRVTIADGCPASVAAHREGDSTAASWITNPETSGLLETFVPGEPTEALICRYTAVRAVTVLPDGGQLEGGALYSGTHLGASAAGALAAVLNDISPSTVAHGCVPPADKPRFTAIVFAIPGRSDVDLWLKDWLACPEVSNGSRSSGELVNGLGTTFLTELDAAAPPAPQQDFPGE
jgi:hypothetical protein